MGKIEELQLQPLGADSTDEQPLASLLERPAFSHGENQKRSSPNNALYTGQSLVTQFVGFDLNDQPIVKIAIDGVEELVCARTTVSLLRKQIGQSVVVTCEGGDLRRPIVLGVIQEHSSSISDELTQPPPLSVQADNDRYVITAEREIVLQCGDASITLTRAGKVIIKGNYVLSRSTGYNKIKGAAVDIN